MSSNTSQRTLFNLPVTGLIHLLIVYVIWGSTFLAIRVAVREGAGWDPYSMAGSRLFLAGILLLWFARLRKDRILPRGREWLLLAAYALFIWVIGHGIVVYAEQMVPSGQAALVLGTAPIWGALLEAIVDRRSPSWRMIAGLLLGFVGLFFLVNPGQSFSNQGSVFVWILLVLGTFSWSTGVVFQSRRRVELSSIASSGWQQLLASVGFAVLFFTLEGELPTPSTEAWIAWGFLLVFGSLLAFTSYVIMVKVLPTPVVLTHSYVNPAVALFLGWLILAEEVNVMMIAGTVLILTGVGLVFSAKRRWKPEPPEPTLQDH